MRTNFLLMMVMAMAASTNVSAAEAVPATQSPAASAPVADAGPIATATPEATEWVIERGERIDHALTRWAAKSGWVVTWLPAVTWECPSQVKFSGKFNAAVVQVIEALNQDGKRLRLRVYESSNFMEVVPDVAS